MLLKLLVIWLLAGLSLAQSGSALAQELRIDHVTIAVRDLRQAVSGFTQAGFTVKPGRQHKNGLLNAHVKLPDGSYVEFMSLSGPPADELARTYAGFLEAGEGGAFLALSGPSSRTVSEKLAKTGIKYEAIEGRLWSYIVFPNGSGLEHLFFIQMHRPFKEKSRYLAHPNGVRGIRLVVIEGDHRFDHLLKALGAKDKGKLTLPDGGSGRCWRLPGGAIVVAPKPPGRRRARTVGVGLDRGLPEDALKRLNEFGVIFSNPTGEQCK